MTWAISASGMREDVKAKILTATVRQAELGSMRVNQGEAIQAVVDSTVGNMVSVNASGHNDTSGGGSCTVSVSTYQVAEKLPEGSGVVGTSSAVVGGVSSR